MSHAQDSESVRRSAAAGVTSVEHAWLADEAAIEALAASGAWLVPTLVVTDVNRTLPGLTRVQRERQDLIEEPPSGLDRGGHPPRRPARDRHGHRRGRRDGRHGVARDRPAARPRGVADGRDPGGHLVGGAAARGRWRTRGPSRSGRSPTSCSSRAIRSPTSAPLARPVAVWQERATARQVGQRLSRLWTSGSGPCQRTISSVANRP